MVRSLDLATSRVGSATHFQGVEETKRGGKIIAKYITHHCASAARTTS